MIKSLSKPFSNGTEYMMFLEHYCERCKQNSGCSILKRMDIACFDETQFPNEELLEVRDENGKVISYHQCQKFEPKGETE